MRKKKTEWIRYCRRCRVIFTAHCKFGKICQKCIDEGKRKGDVKRNKTYRRIKKKTFI